MTFVRNHLGLILPLFAILFSLEYLMLFDRTLSRYEVRLKEQYSVVLVAQKDVKTKSIANASSLIEKVEPIDTGKALGKLARGMDRERVEKLKAGMPAFYDVKLKRYPSGKELERLKSALLRLKGVKRVLIFEKVHDRLYGMLFFMKSNFYIFGLLVGVIGFLLIVKQMQIWQYEHRQRLQIMALFGAPLWLRSGVLFRMAVVDALIAIVAVAGVILYLPYNTEVAALMREMGVDLSALMIPRDFGLIALMGLGIALFCALWVVLRFREEL
ncbi:MAG: hypothetical protein GXO33_08890 [Epsilonproteobacteria bacterium]|nr:hypothetical protein [Campylobacterota bacterium]